MRKSVIAAGTLAVLLGFTLAAHARCDLRGRYLSDGKPCAGGGCDAQPLGADSYQISNGGGHTRMDPNGNSETGWIVLPGDHWAGGPATAFDNCKKIDFGSAIWTRIE